MNGRLRLGLPLTALLMGVAVSAWGQTYTAVSLGPLPGGDSINAVGINNSGQVVGTSCCVTGAGSTSSALPEAHGFLYTGGKTIDLGLFQPTGINNSGQIAGAGFDPYERAFLYSGGSMIDLGTLPGSIAGSDSNALAVNDSGQVTGWSNDGSFRSFLYSGGKMSDLGLLPGAIDSNAMAINNSGQVVGYTIVCSTTPCTRFSTSYTTAFLYSRGVTTDLGKDLGGFASFNYSEAAAINDLGQVTGNFSTGNANHALLYSDGVMSDLGALQAGPKVESWGLGINNLGQVVGWSENTAQYAFLYRDGQMYDLTSLVTLPPGVWLSQAVGINDLGQIIALGSDDTSYLLSPSYLPLTVLNPFATYAYLRQAPPTLALSAVLNAPPAISLAADGQSAVVLVYRSASQQPVTFATAASGPGLIPNIPVGSLGAYDPNYLAHPVPAVGSVQTYQVNTPAFGPDSDGNYVFLALLWAPNAMPVPNVFPFALLTLTATQQGTVAVAQSHVNLKPPPLLLVHGIWSSAAGARFAAGAHGFNDWVSARYPHNLIQPVDYGITVGSTLLSSQSFSDPRTQNIFLSNMTDLLARAAVVGMAARTVDVVAHSMGGLVTRYFLSTPGPLSPALLPNPVHKFITIGTPHSGSNLAQALVANQGLSVTTSSPVIQAWCALGSCTLGNVMGTLGKQVSTGAESLEPGSPPLLYMSSSNVFSAIVGSAPTVSVTETLLDVLIKAFLPGQSVSSLLNNHANDTVVDVLSQNPAGSADTATIPGLVHTALCDLGGSTPCPDIGETASPAFWAQAYYWLTGGAGTVPSPPVAAPMERPMSSAVAPSPVLDLSGYTQVAASNVTFLPATGATLTINATASIAATSSTKTIVEVLLPQAVADPTDSTVLYATQSPFTIQFTPTRLGSANFGAIAVFSDNTYAMTTLTYTLQPSGTPSALNLVNAPAASMVAGDSRVIEADALFTSGPINVSQAATYSARSGGATVFSVSTAGSITANGAGADLLDVSYGGVTATARIGVGSCTYALSPANQIVPYTGATVTVQVTTQSGCAWTADSGAAWLPFAQASGNGSGAITLTAGANSSTATQAAFVSVSGASVLVTQPATACTYTLSQTQISAPLAGANGTITATTACPVIASSDQSWLTATPLGSSVQYAIMANPGTTSRNATLTIGSVSVPVVQAGSSSAALQIALAHTGSFSQGQSGAVYTVTVSNQALAAPTLGTVTVTEILPAGLTLVSMSGGATWTCTALPACTTSNVVNGGSSYPAITVKVNALSNAPLQVANQVSVSGGGSAGASASDLTSVTSFSCDLNNDNVTNVADVQLIINEALGLTLAVHDLNHDGVVNVGDVQKEINSALGLGCLY